MKLEEIMKLIQNGEKIDIDRWLSVYKIFFGEDKTFTLTKSEKKLFKMGVYNN